jgi:ferredoxin
MKVMIDAELCTGHGRCYSLAPDLFESDDEGYNLRRGSLVDVPEDQEELGRIGANACPEAAISVVES